LRYYLKEREVDPETLREGFFFRGDGRISRSAKESSGEEKFEVPLLSREIDGGRGRGGKERPGTTHHQSSS